MPTSLRPGKGQACVCVCVCVCVRVCVRACATRDGFSQHGPQDDHVYASLHHELRGGEWEETTARSKRRSTCPLIRLASRLH